MGKVEDGKGENLVFIPRILYVSECIKAAGHSASS